MRRFEFQRLLFDWRGWIALAWALWFGWQYAKMVVDARGAKAHQLISATAPAGRPTASTAPASR